VIAPVVVVADEGANLRLKVARKIIMLQEDTVLQRLVPALDEKRNLARKLLSARGFGASIRLDNRPDR
jgi:hypothetical protein